jgi:hypothetical protein
VTGQAVQGEILLVGCHELGVLAGVTADAGLGLRLEILAGVATGALERVAGIADLVMGEREECQVVVETGERFRSQVEIKTAVVRMTVPALGRLAQARVQPFPEVQFCFDFGVTIHTAFRLYLLKRLVAGRTILDRDVRRRKRARTEHLAARPPIDDAEDAEDQDGHHQSGRREQWMLSLHQDFIRT